MSNAPQTALDLKPEQPWLDFEPVEHRYFLRPSNLELPSVTRILEEAGLIDWSMVPPDVLAAAAARGTAVHQALHYLDDGDLDENSLDEGIHGYVMAYLRFKNQTGFEPHLVEHRGYNPVHRYAGTMDRTGILTKVTGAPEVLLDFKSGIVLPAHALQVAAYADLLPDPRSRLRMALQLKPDGEYKIHEYQASDFSRDLGVFHAAVAVWWWKRSFQK